MSTTPKNKIIGALLGTIVEYYDYSLYGFSASVIAAKFFPNTDLLTSLANTFAVYAVAYLAKPLGALVFGRIGDYLGRKIALNFTIIGMVVPTVLIGLLPEYSTFGIWSTVILVLCRFIQGIFMAGEYDGAAIYVIEHLGAKYHYTASAITRTTGVIGLLLGIGATNFFNAHIFPEWGWRIPFLLSLPLALITLYYRRQLTETPDFQDAKRLQTPLRSIINLCQYQWQILLIVILIAGGFGVTYQVSIVFMKQYLPIVLAQTSLIISTFSVLLVICLGVSMPIAGLCADRFGAMIVIKISVCATIIACMLLSVAITYNMLNLALAACLLLATFIAPFNALAHGIIIKGFPVNERYRSISLGHACGGMLMSGTANYICLMFMKSFGWYLFPVIYVAAFAILSYIAISIYQSQFKSASRTSNLHNSYQPENTR
ncbi:MFS transporter [Candidatus Trichorickettsia mobilis]|uniref:MFS transporter n=1 Tax=Candidatus Trichorickettsia mobilis TaxID=1346319 RepID=A0ABZ0UUC4_9RICK|nr:MFS transporter [Candidatus Trichorickettsia mobilis]WPY01258.1 MFS transporter [Candidatus Trichorickettsia mobilis]